MEPLSQFNPFMTKPSWYEVYWLQPAPAKSESLWRKRLVGATTAFWNARWLAHSVAEA